MNFTGAIFCQISLLLFSIFHQKAQFHNLPNRLNTFKKGAANIANQGDAKMCIMRSSHRCCHCVFFPLFGTHHGHCGSLIKEKGKRTANFLLIEGYTPRYQPICSVYFCILSFPVEIFITIDQLTDNVSTLSKHVDRFSPGWFAPNSVNKSIHFAASHHLLLHVLHWH